MSVVITRPKERRRKRLTSPADLVHLPTRSGQGKWHSRAVLWRYKRKTRRLKQISAASRRRNRPRWG